MLSNKKAKVKTYLWSHLICYSFQSHFFMNQNVVIKLCYILSLCIFNGITGLYVHVKILSWVKGMGDVIFFLTF